MSKINEFGLFRRVWEYIKSPTGAAILGLFGLISGLMLGIYGLVAEHQPQFKFTLASISSVFDLHQPVGGLDVSYAGQSLRATKKSLWSLSVVITNNGNAGIKLSDFDERAPVTLMIVGGEIVDNPVAISAADYLRDGLRYQVAKTELKFAPFILDPSDSVQLNILVLSDEGARPYIESRGKIAGVKSLQVELPDAPGGPSPWMQRILGADIWWVHVVRGVVYSLISLVTILAVVFVFAGLIRLMEIGSMSRKRSERQSRLEGYKYVPLSDNGETNAKLLELYAEGGNGFLVQLARLRRTVEARSQLADQLKNAGMDRDAIQLICKRRYPCFPGERWVFQRLMNIGLAPTTGEMILLPDFLHALDGLIKYLKIDLTRSLLVLEEYWDQEDVRIVSAELVEATAKLES